MKLFKTLFVCVALGAAALQPAALRASVHPVWNNDTPARTIILKNPMAGDAAKFFSGGTVFNFEVFKPGDANAILAAIKSDPAVESASLGPLVGGDYQGINLSLKAAKDKAWFVALFKKAGLNTIKVNNNPVVSVDKL